MIIHQAREERDIATCEMFFDSMSKKHALGDSSLHDSLIVPFNPRAWYRRDVFLLGISPCLIVRRNWVARSCIRRRKLIGGPGLKLRAVDVQKTDQRLSSLGIGSICSTRSRKVDQMVGSKRTFWTFCSLSRFCSGRGRKTAASLYVGCIRRRSHIRAGRALKKLWKALGRLLDERSFV